MKLPLTMLALFASASLSHATLLGIPQNGTYATWDTFSAISFSNLSPTTSDTDAFSAVLTSNSAGSVISSGDRLYSFNFMTNTEGSYDLSLDGIAAESLTTLSLQIKTSNSTPFSTFSVSMTGEGAADQTLLVGTTAEGSGYYIYQWTWTGLSISASQAFEMNVTSASPHVAVDGISVTNVAAVPEPASAALIGFALGGVMILRRRLS